MLNRYEVQPLVRYVFDVKKITNSFEHIKLFSFVKRPYCFFPFYFMASFSCHFFIGVGDHTPCCIRMFSSCLRLCGFLQNHAQTFFDVIVQATWKCNCYGLYCSPEKLTNNVYTWSSQACKRKFGFAMLQNMYKAFFIRFVIASVGNT